MSRVRRTFLALMIVIVAAGLGPRAEAQEDPRYFHQTRQRIDNDKFWTYFKSRGGVRTFGYPVSGTFTLVGFPVQIYQRQVMQLLPNGQVALLNLLDESVMPYTTMNGSTFPASDGSVLRSQPQVGDPDYHAKALEFVRQAAPDTWEGQPVNFHRTFLSAVRFEEAFPEGRGDPGLVSGFALEMWGLPTSKPAYDPSNKNFVYLRFQRGIMHFDRANNTTQGLLLADYFKSILTLRGLPPDLEAEAKGSRFFGQFNPRAPQGLNRPADLPASDLSSAFRRDPIVVVDPGHGGREIGSSARYPEGVVVPEKELNLKVATKLATLLREAGLDVVMTRTTDSLVNSDNKDLTGDDRVTLSDDLQARVDKANAAGADLFVSVHFNGIEDPSKRGTQIFYADERPFTDKSKALAEMMQTSIVKQLGEAGYPTENRGAMADSQMLGRGFHFYLLGPASNAIKRPSEMPGVIGEALYLTNQSDANAVRQGPVQDAIARGYAEAIKQYFVRFPVAFHLDTSASEMPRVG